jgi:hypothetical protein
MIKTVTPPSKAIVMITMLSSIPVNRNGSMERTITAMVRSTKVLKLQLFRDAGVCEVRARNTRSGALGFTDFHMSPSLHKNVIPAQAGIHYIGSGFPPARE